MTKFLRKVIHISCVDSPNVQHGLEQLKLGIEPTNEEVLPGVLSYELYHIREKTFDEIQKCISLYGQFYEGAALLLFPPDRYNASEIRAAQIDIRNRSRAKAIGCDPAEGGDHTAWAIGDDDGLINLISIHTKDTSVIVHKTRELIRDYGVRPEAVMFDRGGGGKQIADILRDRGVNVSDVPFAGTPSLEMARHRISFDVKLDTAKEKSIYKNKRVQMYHELSIRMDPTPYDGNPVKQFAIPAEFSELRRQLSVMPKQYNDEGVYVLPPKTKRDDRDTRQTIHDMLGCSPDEADALVLMVHALELNKGKIVLGAMF